MAVTGAVTPSSTQLTQMADDLRLLQLKLVGLARGDGDPVWDALGALERAQIILRKEAQYDQEAHWEQVRAQAEVQPVIEAALAKLAEPPQPGKSTLFIGTTDPFTNSLTPVLGTGAHNAPVPVPAPAGSPPGVFEPQTDAPHTHVALADDVPPEDLEAPEGTIYVAGMLIQPVVPAAPGAADEHPLAGFGHLFLRVKGERDAERGASGDAGEAGAGADAEDAGHAGGTEPAAAQEEEAGAKADAGAGDAPARDATAGAITNDDGDATDTNAAGDAGARAGSPESSPEADGPGEEGWRAWWQSGASRGGPAWGEAGEGS